MKIKKIFLFRLSRLFSLEKYFGSRGAFFFFAYRKPRDQSGEIGETWKWSMEEEARRNGECRL